MTNSDPGRMTENLSSSFPQIKSGFSAGELCRGDHLSLRPAGQDSPFLLGRGSWCWCRGKLLSRAGGGRPRNPAWLTLETNSFLRP